MTCNQIIYYIGLMDKEVWFGVIFLKMYQNYLIDIEFCCDNQD